MSESSFNVTKKVSKGVFGTKKHELANTYIHSRITSVCLTFKRNQLLHFIVVSSVLENIGPLPGIFQFEGIIAICVIWKKKMLLFSK